MKIAIGGDHSGVYLKSLLVDYIVTLGHEVIDLGTYTTRPVEFTDICRKVCIEVLENRCDRGILCCGSGIEASIAANKMTNIRAAICHDCFSARHAVEFLNSSLLCIGAWIVGTKAAFEIVTAFLKARFINDNLSLKQLAEIQEIESWSATRLTSNL